MNRDDVTRWAREANRYASNQTNDSHDWQEIRDERLAQAAYAAGAAAEREACAKVCDEVSLQAVASWKLAYQPQDQGREMGADDCAAAIRARGQQ